MKQLQRSIVVALAVFLLMCLVARPGLAVGGIAVAPGQLTIIDGLRNGNFDKSVIIFNLGDQATDFTLHGNGDAGEWLSFYELKTPDKFVDRTTVPPKTQKEVGVKMIIPGDATNGEHRGYIEVASVPDASTGQGSGQSVSIAALVSVSITVTGTQVIEGRVNYMNAGDVELGYPLLMQVDFENMGNVVASPKVEIKITQGNNVVDTLTANAVKISAQTNEIIPVKWDTTGKAPATYNAHIVASLDGKIVGEQNVRFEILPLGALTRSGELKGITVESNPGVNLLSKVIGNFSNTGKIDTWAKFTGEVYFGGNLIQTIESERLLVEKGKSETLDAYYKPQQPGSYTIKGQVTYEGKKTDVKEAILKVNAPGAAPQSPVNQAQEPGGAASKDQVYVLIIASLAIIILLIFVVIWRKRRSVQQTRVR